MHTDVTERYRVLNTQAIYYANSVSRPSLPDLKTAGRMFKH